MRNLLSLLRRNYQIMDTKKFLRRDEASGEDSLGLVYNSLEEMWEIELKSPQIRNKNNWYSLGNEYWSNLEPTLASVLGGSDDIHEPDIKESGYFLDFVLEKYRIPRGRVLDCGAGIGRVTKFLLAERFEVVDLLEQCGKFLDFAKKYVETEKARNFFNVGAQDFISDEKYDVIWVQWVLSQLTDEDLLKFLSKIRESLTENGVIIMKENIQSKGFIVHKDDFSVTRSEKMLKHAFEISGLAVLEEKKQDDWPNDLLNLKLFACIPKKL